MIVHSVLLFVLFGLASKMGFSAGVLVVGLLKVAIRAHIIEKIASTADQGYLSGPGNSRKDW